MCRSAASGVTAISRDPDVLRRSLAAATVLDALPTAEATGNSPHQKLPSRCQCKQRHYEHVNP
jgi:hypothetical protein